MPSIPLIDPVLERDQMYTLPELWAAMGRPLPFKVWWLCSHNDRWTEVMFNRVHQEYSEGLTYFWVDPDYEDAADAAQHSGFAAERRYYPMEPLRVTNACKCNYRQVILVTGCRCGRGIR